MRHELKLNVLDQFECLGTNCPANCCTAWRLPVYPDDLANWRRVENSSARTRLLGSVVENTLKGEHFHALRKYADGTCVHFNKEGLCSVQLEYGHEILPAACQKFPRTEVEDSATRLVTARLSCPGIVALLASCKPGDEFQSVRTDDESQRDTLADEVTVSSIAVELTTLVGRVLGVQDVSLDIRIFYIADVLGQITLKAMNETLDHRSLGKLCGRSTETVARRVADIARDANNNKITTNKVQAGRFWHMVYSHSGVYKNSALLQELADLPIVALLQMNESDGPLADAHFIKLYKQVDELRRVAHGKYTTGVTELMESYLRVAFMNNGFPWKPVNGNFNVTFLSCVLPFAKVQLLLWLLGTRQENLSIDDAVQVIAAVERIMATSDATFRMAGEQPEHLRLDQYANSFLGCV